MTINNYSCSFILYPDWFPFCFCVEVIIWMIFNTKHLTESWINSVLSLNVLFTIFPWHMLRARYQLGLETRITLFNTFFHSLSASWNSNWNLIWGISVFTETNIEPAWDSHYCYYCLIYFHKSRWFKWEI